MAEIPSSWILTAFIFKIVAMGILIWVYTFHYSNRNEADIYKYFDDGILLSHVAHHDAGGFALAMLGWDDGAIRHQSFELKYWDRPSDHEFISSNRLIIRFNAFFALLVGSNIWLNSLAACLLAFFGLTLFFRAFVPFISGNERLFFILLFFAPSLLFWSSGVLKEAFIIFGLGAFFYALMTFRTKPEWKMALLGLCGLWMLISMKLYLIAFAVPATYAWSWNQRTNNRKLFLKYSVTILLFIGLAFNVPIWFLGIDPLISMAVHQQEFKCLAEWIGAGSTVFIRDLDGSLIAVILASPQALWNALLRPSPLDTWNLMSIPAIAEVLFGLTLLITASVYRRQLSPTSVNLLYFCATMILMQALLIGLTTPVAGAIVRYRLSFLPFLILGFSILFDPKKLPPVLCAPKN